MIEILFVTIAIIILVTSYAWTDHGLIALISSDKPIFAKLFELRNFMIYNRHIFEYWFAITILLMTLVQIYFLINKNKKPKIRLLFLGIIIMSLAYPFLSTDIFSYLFSAKILYSYHLNPYTTIPETLRDKDIWLSFTYWTHRPFIYGPIALFFYIIPLIIFGANKLLTIFYFSKLANGVLFLGSGIILSKLLKSKRKVVYLWFTNPILLIELVINSHNDNLMIFLAFLSLYFWKNKQKITSVITLISSILTKYVSIVALLLILIKENWVTILSRSVIALYSFFYAVNYGKMQLWYFTWIYLFLPFAKLKRKHLGILSLIQTFLILDKYIKFVSSGNW